MHKKRKKKVRFGHQSGSVPSSAVIFPLKRQTASGKKLMKHMMMGSSYTNRIPSSAGR